ncbi:MAG: hypothetical protein LIP02_01935 [Bacteroidales bacterium]|nr:hypothetical protein [Bacteroidales bacterium]
MMKTSNKIQHWLLILALASTAFLSACKGEKKAEAQEEEVIEAPVIPNCLPDGLYQGEGDFNGKYPFTVIFGVKDDHVAGYYFYNKYKNPILLTGTINPGGVQLQEYADGLNTGDFSAIVQGENLIKGNFTNHKTDKELECSIRISKCEDANIDINKLFADVDGLSVYRSLYPDDQEADSDFEDIEGDASIDELIAQYEKVVDKLIPLIEAAKNQEPGAVSKYFDYYQECEVLAGKLEKVKGEMSVDQMNRIYRINQKLAKQLEGMELQM